ncbi:MAG: hypothetical protein SGI92_05105 [Bryobacteraceae bacterium]|nr:hypothetical protein [Bryobacteraceae bacterium]
MSFASQGQLAPAKPGNEQGVPDPRVKHGCAEKKAIGEALMNEKEAYLVACVLLVVCE